MVVESLMNEDNKIATLLENTSKETIKVINKSDLEEKNRSY